MTLWTLQDPASPWPLLHSGVPGGGELSCDKGNEEHAKQRRGQTFCRQARGPFWEDNYNKMTSSWPACALNGFHTRTGPQGSGRLISSPESEGKEAAQGSTETIRWGEAAGVVNQAAIVPGTASSQHQGRTSSRTARRTLRQHRPNPLHHPRTEIRPTQLQPQPT
ncbi:hypothetical protein AGOR_G00206330 [Albula goreensis]|uniref:Uncharacterized protein n=1 Tax=Albula goreensis TaxID=1534307 RepID=A0A8T3CQ64_9TELE|nr:hypothetical protein AGOR_G00206330 [Albula goreensis]